MDCKWDWPGARWWRCDFHLHAGASRDFSDRESLTGDQWVAAARAAALDAVAVTDHNSGEFIDRIREAARRPGRRLVVFPGVELTVSPGVHLLVLFDLDSGRDAVTGLLASCGIPEAERGTDKACAPCSVVDAMAEAAKAGAICIAAHADEAKGILKELTPGQALQQIIRTENLHAIEANCEDSELLRFVDNTTDGYQRELGPLPILTFSDAHSVDQIGRRATWIKMTEPSLDGLRLALQDGDLLSVRNAFQGTRDPNTHASLAIEAIEVQEARYMGRGNEHQSPFEVRLNPWLNTIIGGRGTGKSSLLAFLRIAMRREDELPRVLRDEFEELKKIPATRREEGLLTDDTEIRVTYRRDGLRFRIQWDWKGNLDPILEEQADGTWSPVERLQVGRRFPIRIYSQKQIFELARDPEALLRIVDDAGEVAFVDWRNRWREEESRFLSLRTKAREIEVNLAQEPDIRADLADVRRKLAVFEEAGHAEVLKVHQRFRRQRRAIEQWEEDLRGIGKHLRTTAEDLEPDLLDSNLFDHGNEVDQEILNAVATVSDRLGSIQKSLTDLATDADAVVADWKAAFAGSQWQTAAQDAALAYDELIATLRDEQAGDPGEYGSLIQSRQNLERRLRDLSGRRQALERLKQQISESRLRLLRLRKDLTDRRARFLSRALASDPHVRIAVLPYGAVETAEGELRTILGVDGVKFTKDLGSGETESGLLGQLYSGMPAVLDGAGDDPHRQEAIARFEARLQDLKARIAAISHGEITDPEVQDRRFGKHLERLSPGQLDRLECWFPEDTLKVSYSPHKDGRRFRPIAQGSPGQKTAALLAFLLSYGDEPVILDQPEDDLDNQLIYDLIVTQLREIKRHRQVLVVTHNANIVVNGDAELVISFDARGGQTRKITEGGLQEQDVRDEICRVLEGGRQAFELRYRRIAKGGGHA